MHEPPVVSTKNQYVKMARQLSTRQGRDKSHAFLVEGVRAVSEVLEWGKAQAILFDVDQLEREAMQGLVDRARQQDLETIVLEHSLFETMVATQTPQGVMAIVPDIAVGAEVCVRSQLVVISDGLQDPGNIGTLIRLADAVGADAFIATRGSVDIYNPKVVRSTMGSLFHLNMVRDVDSSDLVTQLQQWGYTIVAADADGEQTHFDYHYTFPLAVVFGNEGAGLSAEWKGHADLVRIPMPGRAESLNVAIAAGILLYEVVRQLRL